MNKNRLSFAGVLITLLPATAMAEGGYYDSGGCEHPVEGAVLVALLIVGLWVALLSNR